jgi:hypothetical protein
MTKAQSSVYQFIIAYWNCSGQETYFFLFEITELQWLKFLITQPLFNSPFKFEPPKFCCILFTSNFKSALF